MMIAVLNKVGNAYTARYERHLKHSAQAVWSYLTDNEKLVQWFSELRIEELREGGIIKFDMQDGTFEEFIITDYRINAVLAFTWGEDHVRFELHPEAEGCLLVLVEQINTITSHTPRDLAGWHVCLDVIIALLDGKTLESRDQEWKNWYPKYVEAIAAYQ